MFPHQNPVCSSPLPHTCYMPCPSHYSRFGHPNNMRWAIQIMYLAIMLSPLPCYLVPLRPKYSPQHTILKHPQLMFLTSMWATMFHTKTTQKIIVLYILFFIFLDRKMEDERFCTEWSSIPWLQSALYFFLNGILIRRVCSQISKLFHTFKGTIINPYTVTSSCILISRHDHVKHNIYRYSTT